MIVCHCQVVTETAVAEVVDAGARTLGQVCRTTGAGTDCGACVFTVKRLLTERRPTSAGARVAPRGRRASDQAFAPTMSSASVA